MRIKEKESLYTPVYAKHNGTIGNEKLLEKVQILKYRVQPVAKRIGVSALLEVRIAPDAWYR